MSTNAEDGEIGNPSEDQSYIASRNKLNELEIIHAQERINIAYREYEKFKENFPDANPRFQLNLEGLVHEAQQSMALLTDRHETRRQNDLMEHRAEHVSYSERLAKLAEKKRLEMKAIHDGVITQWVHQQEARKIRK